MSRWQTQTLVGFILLLIGVAAGHYLLPQGSFPLIKGSIDYNEENSDHTFINPLLFCADQNISNYTNAVPTEIEKKLNELIDGEKSKGNLADASVYYKDLNGGPWVLINNEMKTVPASLLKVPTAMALYKRAEKDASFMQKTFTLPVENTVNKTQYFQPKKMVVANTPYTTEDLIGYMLQDSDNAALYMLGQSLPEKDFEESYNDLGIDPPTEVAPGYTINVKTYASFFRVLFNASYLSPDASEHMLSLLSKSSFDQGISAGIPKNITVADKFGEFIVSDTDKRLNDCGIIYRPRDPYILCVMTRGSNFDKLANVISGISLNVWSVLEEHKN